MRIVVALVVEMTDAQVKNYADTFGLPRKGGRLTAREVTEDVKDSILSGVQQMEGFYEGAADVSLRTTAGGNGR